MVAFPVCPVLYLDVAIWFFEIILKLLYATCRSVTDIYAEQFQKTIPPPQLFNVVGQTGNAPFVIGLYIIFMGRDTALFLSCPAITYREDPCHHGVYSCYSDIAWPVGVT